MPLPKPRPTESEKDFIQRCMSEANEFPDQEQRMHKRQLDLELAILLPQTHWIVESDFKESTLQDAANRYATRNGKKG